MAPFCQASQENFLEGKSVSWLFYFMGTIIVLGLGFFFSLPCSSLGRVRACTQAQGPKGGQVSLLLHVTAGLVENFLPKSLFDGKLGLRLNGLGLQRGSAFFRDF